MHLFRIRRNYLFISSNYIYQNAWINLKYTKMYLVWAIIYLPRQASFPNCLLVRRLSKSVNALNLLWQTQENVFYSYIICIFLGIKFKEFCCLWICLQSYMNNTLNTWYVKLHSCYLYSINEWLYSFNYITLIMSYVHVKLYNFQQYYLHKLYVTSWRQSRPTISIFLTSKKLILLFMYGIIILLLWIKLLSDTKI